MSKKVELKEAIEFLEYNALKGSNAKAILRMGDIYEVLEPIKELAYKNTPKKPDYEGDGYDDNGEIIYDTWICPNCGKRYEVDYDDYDYCHCCGQRINFGGIEDE